MHWCENLVVGSLEYAVETLLFHAMLALSTNFTFDEELHSMQRMNHESHEIHEREKEVFGIFGDVWQRNLD